ncbi:chromosome-associated kinesin KIF4A [Anabrus simplex]|uniref:chromosome-associated kinesin KIF4A n=1 Tax=Anabrus simplex TaxID=316456 RepID=UPI0035A3C71E
MSDKNVKVALRVRPLIQPEVIKGYQQCLYCVPDEPQVQVLGSDKAFTFNHVFGPDVSQKTIYDRAVKDLLSPLFEGYNVTILAYGQTGSGKTYTMGTCCVEDEENVGVIPRAVDDIFKEINELSNRVFSVTVSFMELHQEQLYDLLSQNKSSVDIREDGSGIKIPGLTEVPVSSRNETLTCLAKGSSVRATGATAMNVHSSRSHAIFTITISQEYKDKSKKVSSKFHLVDLAGSERSKKTKTTGTAFKEGVNINKGLLALGNVISALGEEGHSGYITYRNSKLTRLLQDSLGGNAITLMIACVSPADYNFDETLCTLRYADRALHIKNKPVINRDLKEEEVARLKQQVLELQLELMGASTSKKPEEGQWKNSHEYDSLISKNRALTEAINNAFNANANLLERASIAEAARDRMKDRLNELKNEYDQALKDIQEIMLNNDLPDFHLKLNFLEDLGRKIKDIQMEHLQSSDEILKHELNENKLCNVSPGQAVESESSLHEELQEASFDEEHEALTMQQVQLNKQLQELNKALALKEELVAQLQVNTENISVLKEDSQNNSLKGQLVALQKERENLVKLLADKPSSTAASKNDLPSAARLSELDCEISKLKNKLPVQENVLKMKGKLEDKLSKLNSEIQHMKQDKVRLIKQLKQTSSEFRTYKAQRQREVIKLENEGRKFQTRILRMEQLHNKQENVWRRKVEEANAVAKRLKDTLALQKNILDKNPKENASLKFQNMIDRDLQLTVHTMEAEKTLEELIEHRAMQVEQLGILKNDPNKENNLGKIKKMSEDLAMRNVQIRQLQQKILASDQDNKSKTRWDKIQSISEAKHGLKYLFNLAAEMKKEINTKNIQLSELEASKVAAEETIKSLEEQIRDIDTAHEIDILRIEKENEEKFTVLLSEIRKEESTGIKIHKKRKRDSVSFTEIPPEVLEDEEVSFEDDTSADPDWKKTPIFRRLHRLKKVSLDENVPVKRDSSGRTKCSCKGGNCTRRNCGCRKNDSFCGDSCKCNASKCENKPKEGSTPPPPEDPPLPEGI